MSERPLHKQVSDFVSVWMRSKRDAEDGIDAPISHRGPARGPRDWYIGMGMIAACSG